MDYIALYRKWRPMTFDDVVEQGSVVTILKNTVRSGRIAHAYLFCGTRGTGKTSVAKIFSRAVNCLSPHEGNPCNQCEICRGIIDGSLLDVSEIDAASNSGVENVRSIIEESSYQAARAEYKVFIIDEVHNLSTPAFNALLKTLEEPPEKVIFILATTEAQKIPVTIASRCQRFDFKRISRDGIIGRLEEICHSMNLDYEEGALRLIAAKADGGLRDAISLLDQTISYSQGKITLAEARRAVGSVDSELLEGFAGAILSRDSFSALNLTETVFSGGGDPSVFIGDLIELMRNLMIILSTRNPGQFLYEEIDDLERLKALASQTNLKELTMLIRELSGLENSLKWSVQRKILFEAGMLSLCDRSWGKDSELSDRIQVLEHSVADLVSRGLKVAVSGAPRTRVRENAAAAADDETAGEQEEAPAEETPPVSVKDLTSDVIKDLKPVEPADWNDFVSAVSRRYGGVASILSTQCSNSYVIGGTLFVPITKYEFARMISDETRKKALESAAAETFGRSLAISVLTEEEFYRSAPELLKRADTAAAEADTFTELSEKLDRFARDNDIPFDSSANEAPAPQGDAPEEMSFSGNPFGTDGEDGFLDNVPGEGAFSDDAPDEGRQSFETGGFEVESFDAFGDASASSQNKKESPYSGAGGAPAGGDDGDSFYNDYDDARPSDDGDGSMYGGDED